MSTNQANGSSSTARSRSPFAFLRKTTGKGITSRLFGTSPRKNAKCSSPAALSSPKTCASTPSPDKPKSTQQVRAETVHVILLLLSVNSRRFELLQLEFDPNIVRVSDLIASVSASASDEELRNQKYIGICRADGTELPMELLLKDGVKTENEVMVAVPEGATAFSCTKLAAPILNDPKVRFMVSIHLSTSTFLKYCSYLAVLVFAHRHLLLFIRFGTPASLQLLPRKETIGCYAIYC
jgi:hypothetical protein